VTFVKICGITNQEDVREAVELGADALGFNFYPKSKRYIAAADARALIEKVPAHVWKVGIFVNAEHQDIIEIAEEAKIDTIQLHGDETPEFVRQLKMFRTIKAARIGPGAPPFDPQAYLDEADFLLIDRFEAGEYGGMGRAVADTELESFRPFADRILLAGGLTPENVREKIAHFHPFGVDVTSGVEAAPGKKDLRKLWTFFDAIRP